MIDREVLRRDRRIGGSMIDREALGPVRGIAGSMIDREALGPVRRTAGSMIDLETLRRDKIIADSMKGAADALAAAVMASSFAEIRKRAVVQIYCCRTHLLAFMVDLHGRPLFWSREGRGG